MRENVFTQFARDIVDFSEHRITRKELYNLFVGYIEMCDETEKKERLEWLKKMEIFGKEPISSSNKKPYSNYDRGIHLINERK